ncbi:spore coat protein F-like protein YhcQ [Paenibacillus chitinolyticus]|uniref:spore coat protein n=1 Tax=Paenibacillus chitinolyticus TaxID=79263 RepID=UPI0026E49815|nr:spore coat protein [Paenibacillus chitinolyticus]GKS13085.1 spore coat protein F-like protein YhcQ [Paenibacillus chitinolyticus]
MQQQNYFNNQYQQGLPNFNHGGHEFFDMHEVLSGTINVLDQFMLFRTFVKDPELLDIIDRQYSFILSQYNLTAECFATGRKPSHETSTYMMQQPTNIQYGIKPSQPKKPNQSLADVKDAGISGHMLGLIKTHASLLTMSAAEVTNPVVRRVLASQVQNFIELAYEIFLYQNKHAYYQVPQLQQNDMQSMLNTFVPTPGYPQSPIGNQGIPANFAPRYQ